MRKKPVIPVHKTNEKRSIAKNKRGRGKLAMGNNSEAEWSQIHDPLFKIKGMERYKRMQLRKDEYFQKKKIC